MFAKWSEGVLAMGHCVRAIIGAHKAIQRIEKDWYANEINLPQGYGMIFLTDALLDNIAELFESANELSTPDAVTNVKWHIC